MPLPFSQLLVRRFDARGAIRDHCKCACHDVRLGDGYQSDQRLRQMIDRQGLTGAGGAPVLTTDVLAAVAACAHCAPLHCPALTVDHDALEAREQEQPRAEWNGDDGG